MTDEERAYANALAKQIFVTESVCNGSARPLQLYAFELGYAAAVKKCRYDESNRLRVNRRWPNWGGER